MTSHDCDFAALIHAGADYSVITSNLAPELKKVLTKLKGPNILTAGNHLIAPTSLCTARVGIRGYTCVGGYIVLAECSRDVILGIDFRLSNKAMID